MTSKYTTSLNVSLQAKDRTYAYAYYDTFSIGGENTEYQLSVSGYSGSAGDSLANYNGHKFTTYDRDNDLHATNCAKTSAGAWWYK